MSENCIRGCGSSIELRSNSHLNSLSIKPSLKSPSNSSISRSVLSRSILSKRVAKDHEQEWLDSGVDGQIIHLNVQTLIDSEVDEHCREMRYPIAERLNWNVRQSKNRTLRGWWVSGIDPLANWQQMSWGRFKPDAATPVITPTTGKSAKYLSPSLGKGSSRLVLLDVPSSVWQRVADRYQISITRNDTRTGFWSWVQRNAVPVVLTEGEKKAGCLLTVGYAAIALPGIFGGYRKENNQLIPELAVFTEIPRNFLICFDYESRLHVAQQVNNAIGCLGHLFSRPVQNSNDHSNNHCNVRRSIVKVVELPGPEKGVDDFIVGRSAIEFESVVGNSMRFEHWQQSQAWKLSYSASQVVNLPFLSGMNYPSSGLICVKSPKGTGKTTALRSFLAQPPQVDRKVLVITHRIQLGRAICQGLGLPWVSQIKDNTSLGMDGYGLCVDSLYATSQANFMPEDWANSIVILDEVEQVIWHALNSPTCANTRVRILETFRELIQTVLNSGGVVIAQDADLSNISIEYLLSLLDEPIEPWVLINQWHSDRFIQTQFYDTQNPAALILQMERIIETGPIYVCLDSQKVRGRWSSRNLETYFSDRFPEKRILRVDSETVVDRTHPAYGIASNINAVMQQYDIVLATPTIGTGVSIDLKDHFVAVFAIFNGVMSDTESRQALARVRSVVPRYIWVSSYGLGKIGNGSSYYRELVRSTTKAVRYNMMLLREVDFDVDRGTDPVTLRTWSKMAARVNLSLNRYRMEMYGGLEREGHRITTVTDNPIEILGDAYSLEAQYDLLMGTREVAGFEYLYLRHDAEEIEHIYNTIAQVREENKQAEAEAIASSIEYCPDQADLPMMDQRYSQRKQELKCRYVVNVTPDLQIKDAAGWYPQLRLHYYLTHDPLFVRLRDRKLLDSMLQQGNGMLALQDVKLITAQVEMLRALDLAVLFDPDRRTRTTDEDMQRLWAMVLAHRQDMRILFGINVTDKTAPMTAIQSILGKMNLRLVCVSRDRNLVNGCRGGLRVYKFVIPEDNRLDIFKQWKNQDTLCLKAAT
jgi:hypothetical protein